MQIAIREFQPRLGVPGGHGSAAPVGGQPFDELVRAISAREPGRDAGRPANDPVRAERPRDPARRERTDEARAGEADRPDDTERGEDRARGDDTAAAAVMAPVEGATTPGAGRMAGQPDNAGPQAVRGKADSHQPDQVQPRPQAAGATPGSGAAPDQPATPGLGDDLLALLPAHGIPGAAAPGRLLATFPAAPLMPGPLLAQTLAGAPQATQPGSAPGQRIMAAQAPGKAAARAASGTPGGDAAASGPAPDFRAIATALAGGAPSSAATAATATAAAAVDGAGANGGSANGNAPLHPGAQPAGERPGQAARADAPAAPHRPPLPNGPQFAERIGLTIARAAEAGVDRVSIRLNPAELGRIDVQMELGQDGRMTLSVAADRPETLDQLQRHVRDLERALNDAGFDAGAGDLNFSLRQQNPSGDHEPGSGRHGGHGDGEPAAEPDAEGAEDGIVITHRSGSHMVVDLFV